MKFVAFLAVTVAVVCAAPLPDAPTQEQMQAVMAQFTPEVFINAVKQFIGAFGEYVPACIKTELDQMTANTEEVKAFTTYWQGAIVQKIEPPKDPKAAMTFYKQNLPLTAPRLERIEKCFNDNFAKISQPGQDYLNQFNTKLEAVEVPHNDSKTAVNLVNFLNEQNELYIALAEPIKAEYSTVYPEFIKFVNTSEFKNYLAKLQPLKGKSDAEIMSGLGEAMVAFAPLYSKMH